MSDMKKQYSCAVITLSDKGAAGLRDDTSGKSLKSILNGAGFFVDHYVIIPDDEKTIVATLIDAVDEKHIDLVVTTGGTGLSPRDVTPEATRKVIEKEVPGMAEAMRAESFAKTPHAVLSRGISGIRKNSLIVNLPGSKKRQRRICKLFCLPSRMRWQNCRVIRQIAAAEIE